MLMTLSHSAPTELGDEIFIALPNIKRQQTNIQVHADVGLFCQIRRCKSYGLCLCVHNRETTCIIHVHACTYMYMQGNYRTPPQFHQLEVDRMHRKDAV